jgi:flagellar biosynthesis/type III secretory pathway M-ring protein FliF/YscJ
VQEIVTVVISAVVGGAGFVGLAFWFLRSYIEKRILKNEREEEKRKELSRERKKVDDELQHCEGRLFFWIHKAIVTGVHNGDLEAAFEAYTKAEEQKKQLDRDIIYRETEL